MEVGETSLNTYAGLFVPCDFIYYSHISQFAT